MNIFMSYRRHDTSGYALGLRREFARNLPEAQVFLDVESLDAGVRWRDAIRDYVDRSDVMIIVIGDEWLETRDRQRKLENADDPVRLELEAAFARPEMHILPVLVEDAPMPPGHELPETVQALCDYHAHAIHDRTYDADVNALVERLGKLSQQLADMAEPSAPPQPAPLTRPRTPQAEPVPPAPNDSAYPSKITPRWLEQAVPGMGREQLLDLIRELLRRGWSHDDAFDWAISTSPLKPQQFPHRITPGWLAANVPLLSPAKLDKLVKTLESRGWKRDSIRTHVYANRQPGLAEPIPGRIATRWVEANAPLMTATEQEALAEALLARGWSEENLWYYLPYARLKQSD